MARSTSRNEETSSPSTVSSRSPGCSVLAASVAAATRSTVRAWRRLPLCASSRSSQGSGKPSLRALASGSSDHSVSSEYTLRSSRTMSMNSESTSAGIPRVIWPPSLPPWMAKLDQLATTLPRRSASTPSTAGALTTETSSTLKSRNRSVREIGIVAGLREATRVSCRTTRCEGVRPTTQTGSSGFTATSDKRAARTGVSPMSAGSYSSMARLCSGCT